MRELLADTDNIHLIEPLDHESFLNLMLQSRFVVTHSGAVQEEAPDLGRPVLLMRAATERVEALGGSVRMVGTDAARIFKEDAVANYDSVADWDAAHNMVEQAKSALSRLDRVVNNAGVLRDVIFHKMTGDDYDAVIKCT